MTATGGSPPREYLSTVEVAGRLGRSDETVRRWVRDGLLVGGQVVRLDALKLGANYGIRPAALAEFLRAVNPGRAVELAGEREAREEDARAASKELDRLLGKR